MRFSAVRVEALKGDNEVWHQVGPTNDFGVTFQNSWANVGGANDTPAGFYKDAFNIVHLRGRVDTGVTTTYIFTLPEGYRPEYDHLQLVVNNNGGPGPGGASVYVQIYGESRGATAGRVYAFFTAGTDMYLDGIFFRAA